MTFSQEPQVGFRFREQAEFDLLVSTLALEPGCFYFVGKMFHIAFSPDTYRTFGNGATIQEIVDAILQDELLQAGAGDVINQIINDLRTLITNEFVEQIVNDITIQSLTQIKLTSVSLFDPDGQRLGENVEGEITVPAATNERFGIVKGADNTSPETWNKVSVAPDGTMGVNKEAFEALIEVKVPACSGGTPLEKMVADPGREVIGIMENKDLVVQQASPDRFGVVKCNKTCACYPKPLSLQSLDGTLVAEIKQSKHLFFPMAFPDKKPDHIDLFDKLTFISNTTITSCRRTCIKSR